MAIQHKPQTSTWKVDPGHSNVDFEVKHLMISTVRGHFRKFDADVFIDEETPGNSRVSATIDVASIETGLDIRDDHLRSDDFFNAEHFPAITFVSRAVERLDESRFSVAGDLTIRDVTRAVVLDGEFEGRIQDPWGKERAAFSARTEISREEFNVRWKQVLETGGMVVSDRVKIRLYIEAVREEPVHLHVERKSPEGASTNVP
jgi:polyisoprenoid-binding protein YceI